MAIGRRGHRGLLMAALAVTTGCRWMPARRPEPPLASSHTATLPPLPQLRPIDDREAFATATPLLDAAASREAAIREVQVRVAEAPPPTTVPAEPETPAETASSPTMDPQVSQAGFEVATPPEPVSAEAKPEIVAEPPPEPIAADPAPSQDDDPWMASLKRLRDLARERQGDGGPEAQTWSDREKVIQCLATDDDALWTPVAHALATPFSETPSDPQPNPGVPPVVVPDAPGLAILDLRLCKKVSGFGRFEELPGGLCMPGRQVLLYCELDGVRDEVVDSEYRSRLAAQVDLVRADDQEVVWHADLGEQEDRCARRRRDFYASYRIAIPADLPGGLYQIRLNVSDRIGHHDAARAAEITVGR